MKKKILAVIMMTFLFITPVVAQDSFTPVAPGNTESAHVVGGSGVATSEAPGEAAPPEPMAEPEEEKPVKLPWMLIFFWPVISTAAVALIKAVSDKFEKDVPPQLWPLCNTILVAVIVGIQSSGSPQEVAGNVLASVLASLGFVKTLDGGKGKWSAVKPAEKKAAKKAGLVS